MYDLFAIGDITFDIFSTVSEARVRRVPSQHKAYLEIAYKDKIPVDAFALGLGGSATNTAIGVARHGFKVGLYAVYGDDCFGGYVHEQLAAEKVDHRHVYVERGGQTNVSTILVHQSERTILPYYVPRTYSLPKIPRCTWMYVTSGGKGFEKLFPAIVSHAKKRAISLVVNAGPYQLRHAPTAVRRLVKVCRLLVLNKEEAQMLIGQRIENDAKLIHTTAKLGPSTIVMTDGERGAYAFDGRVLLHIDTFPNEAVEKTGAGDAFTSGYLAATIDGMSVADALRAGSMNAASVIQHVGAQKGLLTKKELHAMLEKYATFKPRPV